MKNYEKLTKNELISEIREFKITIGELEQSLVELKMQSRDAEIAVDKLKLKIEDLTLDVDRRDVKFQKLKDVISAYLSIKYPDQELVGFKAVGYLTDRERRLIPIPTEELLLLGHLFDICSE